MYGGGGYGYGGGMYGNNMYGGGFGYGPGMDPNNPNNQSLTQTWNQSTAATFQIMESIVGAFGGFAQMLESAYMTTHSSFFGKSHVKSQASMVLTLLQRWSPWPNSLGTSDKPSGPFWESSH